MALVARAAGVLPLIASVVAAAALAGAAVFTVAQAGCSAPGHYVTSNGQVVLVGGCLDRDDLTTGTNNNLAGNADSVHPQVRP
ncbi:MAG TPA: hypothetical protein VG247_05195 [Pseudonocardiaceae bacterium]|jgi:hypothetical protein|nr:hypothetical protein [Pseudonocardiaceae bacterium]